MSLHPILPAERAAMADLMQHVLAAPVHDLGAGNAAQAVVQHPMDTVRILAAHGLIEWDWEAATVSALCSSYGSEDTQVDVIKRAVLGALNLEEKDLTA
jgi:hypothetical protein